MENKRLAFAVLLICAFISGYGQTNNNPVVITRDPGQKMNTTEIKLLIDSISGALNRWYVYPEKAVLMADAIKTSYKNGAYENAKNRREIAKQIFNDLQKANTDYSMNIIFHPVDAKLFNHLVDEKARQDNFEMRLKAAREHNFSFVKAEVLPDNIGYLRWDGFYAPAFMEEAKPIFIGAFQIVKNCKALIIDMRYNDIGYIDMRYFHVGYTEMVPFTQSFFFNKKTRMNDIIDRNNDTVKRWADPSIAEVILNMPLYILTSRRTFMSGEDFAYGLQQAKRATIVGDTTDGTSHPGRPFNMGQGFPIQIPILRAASSISKTDWEGKGVRPDIPVSSEQALIKAQELIYNAFMANATNQTEKQKFQWMATSNKNTVELAKAQAQRVKIPNETLSGYCGNYLMSGESASSTSIIQMGDFLYKRLTTDIKNPESDIRLIPVSVTRFIYDDGSARSLEFSVEANGTINAVLSKSDGEYTFTKKK